MLSSVKNIKIPNFDFIVASSQDPAPKTNSTVHFTYYSYPRSKLTTRAICVTSENRKQTHLVETIRNPKNGLGSRFAFYVLR